MLPYGVATARRAWVEPKDVINCWTKDKLLKWLKSRGSSEMKTGTGSPAKRRTSRQKSRV